jgi:hypothetical protein
MIAQSRADAGWNFPWYVAEVSFSSSSNLVEEERIVAAQLRVIQPDEQVFAGPATDDFHLEGKLHDEVHFNADGLADHAQQWMEVLGGTPSLAVKNGDFEAMTALSEGGISIVDINSDDSPSIIGWRLLDGALEEAADGFCGYYKPDDSYYDGSSEGLLPGMSGPHVAFISDSSPGAGFVQTRRRSLAGGRTYLLKLALGVRGNDDSFGGATVELRSGGNVLASNSFDRAALDALNEGDAANTFTEVEVAYTTPSVVTAGQPISLRIAKNEAGAGSYLDFDNVTLTSAETPFASWQIDNWQSPGSDDAAFNADPDGDGFANGFVFYMGLDPMVEDRIGVMGPIVSEGRTVHRYRVPLDSKRDQSQFELRYSFDLRDWIPAETLADGSVESSKAPDFWSVEIATEEHSAAFFQMKALNSEEE